MLKIFFKNHKFWFLLFVQPMIVSIFLFGCASKPLAPAIATQTEKAPYYIIGPGDQLEIFVWGNEDISSSIAVRPDGRINSPLIEDLQASGKTPAELAHDIESRLSTFVKTPIVTVMVSGFVGRFSEQIRVAGEAAEPQALSYIENMSLLDVMIQVGGLTEFAAGNRSTLIRTVNGTVKEYRVRLNDLVKSGDITANIQMLPGDILIIPESFF
ncbi:hypothetical protein NURINAE_01396 [Candidatus Nitrosacidococcus sp. I8]|nr:hypothetical protein NURINAE_01396 [Candidatus Nitrosacidococcus sp. I8]